MQTVFLSIISLFLLVTSTANASTPRCSTMTIAERKYRDQKLLAQCKAEKGIKSVRLNWNIPYIKAEFAIKKFSAVRIPRREVGASLCPAGSEVGCENVAFNTFSYSEDQISESSQPELQLDQLAFFCADWNNTSELVVEVQHEQKNYFLTTIYSNNQVARIPVNQLLNSDQVSVKLPNGTTILKIDVLR